MVDRSTPDFRSAIAVLCLSKLVVGDGAEKAEMRSGSKDNGGSRSCGLLRVRTKDPEENRNAPAREREKSEMAMRSQTESNGSWQPFRRCKKCGVENQKDGVLRGFGVATLHY